MARIRVALKLPDFGAVRDSPAVDIAGDSGFTARGMDKQSIRRKRQGIHVALESAEFPHRGAGDGIEELHLATAADCDQPRLVRVREGVDRPLHRSLGRDLRRGHLTADHGLLSGDDRWPLGAGIDPSLDQRDLAGFQMLAFSRRHELILAAFAGAAFEEFHQQAFVGVARLDGPAGLTAGLQTLEGVERQLAIRIILRVALDAMRVEQWEDVPLEIDRLRAAGCRRGGEGNKTEGDRGLHATHPEG